MQKINIQIASIFLIFHNFGVIELFESYILLQTILFLTESVFRVLFAYFDESMVSKIVYNP